MTFLDIFKTKSTYDRWNSIPSEASWLRMFTKCLRNEKLPLGNSQDVCAFCLRKIFLFSVFAVRLAFVVELSLHLHFLEDWDKSGASENEPYQWDFNLSVNKTIFPQLIFMHRRKAREQRKCLLQAITVRGKEQSFDVQWFMCRQRS